MHVVGRTRIGISLPISCTYVSKSICVVGNTHTYMESGLSFLPNDRDFGAIEKRSKKHLLSVILIIG